MTKERQRRKTKYDPNTPAANVVDKFGGLTKMSEGTGIAVSTIYGWVKRGRVPSDQFPALLDHAKRLRVKLKPEDLFTPVVPQGDVAE